MIRDGGMFETYLSMDGWKSAVLAFTILGWVCAGLSLVSGIIVYVAKANIEVLKEAPRAVEHAPALQPHTQAPTVPITVIAFGYGEPIAYAHGIIEGLTKAGFSVRRMTVGFRPDAPTGVTVVPNGNDANELKASLDQAGIKYSIGQTHHIPGSAIQSAADSVVLEIGAK
jgi:hypothetical protein